MQNPSVARCSPGRRKAWDDLDAAGFSRSPTALKAGVIDALCCLWLAGSGWPLKAQASPMLPPPAPSGGDVVVYVDSVAGGLLKGRLDSSSWTKIAAFKQGKHSMTPLASGRQLAVYEDIDSQNESVTVFDVGTGQPLFAQRLPRNTVVEAGPVFGKPSHYLLRTITGTSDDNQAFIVDLKAGSVAATFASGGLDNGYAALPDGRLYRISKKTGAIAIGSAPGTWTDSGRLAIPANLSILSWRVNHQANKLAIVYALNSSGTFKTDVWVANIDGSSPYRLTNLGHAAHPVWSPDDNRIAFSYDTLSDMVGGLPGSATGQCSYWNVPTDARDVSGLVKDQQHAVARQMTVNFSGIKNYPACNIIAWEKT